LDAVELRPASVTRIAAACGRARVARTSLHNMLRADAMKKAIAS
jgi:hypothetical protein